MKKIIKRRSKSGASSKPYFTEDTQSAIEEYQNESSELNKEHIYNTRIAPAFEQLAESLIHVYQFNSPNDSISVIKDDCVTFLYETILKWKPDRGTKAFSYFNVVAKNWLIVRCRNSSNDYKKHISLSEFATFSNIDKEAIANYQAVPAPDDHHGKENFELEITKVILELESRVKKQNEIICLEAIKAVFNNIENLDFLNKRAIYIYIREISGLNSKQLSVAMSKIRRYYKQIVKDERLVEFF